MMKTISSCAVLLLMCYFVQSAPTSEPQTKKDVKAIHWRCAFAREYWDSKFDIKKYYGKEQLDRETSNKCYMACAMEDLGQMNPDGTINAAYADEVIESHPNKSEEEKTKFKEAYQQCTKVGKAGGNKCEIAGALWECLQEFGKKLDAQKKAETKQ